MSAIFYIGKRTLLDILRTPVFWVTIILAGFICFSILFWGWHQIEREFENGFPEGGSIEFEMGKDSGDDDGFGHGQRGSGDWNPLSSIKPEVIIMWYVYGITVGFGSLLGIYIMLGLIGRELDRRTIELLLSRPLSRTHIYLGKLVGGWISLIIFMAVMAAWTLISMQVGGMGIQEGYFEALLMGTLAPIFISSVTLVMTLWMHWILAGFLGNVILFASSTMGLFMIKILGVEVLKMTWPVRVIYKILPPMNVIGQNATDHLETDTWSRFVFGMFEQLAPSAEDGLYTEMWQVYVYFAVVLIIGWLSFFRRQFT